MSVTVDQIVVYGAANIAENNTSGHGGAIDTSKRYIFGDHLLANNPAASGGDGTLRYYSTNNADNGVDVTITGRNTGGSIVTETKTLANSGVVQTGTQVFERILKVVTDAHNYDVLVIEPNTSSEVVTIESGVTEVRRPFYNVSSDPNGIITYYEKTFVRNNHPTLNLLEATFIDGGGDTEGYITFALANAVNSNEALANRLTPPTGTGAGGFSQTTKTLLTEAGQLDLQATEAIPVWIRMTLPQNEGASLDFWTLSISGQTI